VPAEDDVDALARVLVRACRALADAGHAPQAGRLAADGWAALRATHPRQARHLDGAMHYIARLHQQQETQSGKEISMTTDQVLDVRAEPPARRHELILDTFAKLHPGEDYLLVNDHDPKPLRYQFEAEHPGEFTWAHLEEGPEVWRVRIGRTVTPETASAQAWSD
jgi:uncharacterized protein (DUF2249 family)